MSCNKFIKNTVQVTIQLLHVPNTTLYMCTATCMYNWLPVTCVHTCTCTVAALLFAVQTHSLLQCSYIRAYLPLLPPNKLPSSTSTSMVGRLTCSGAQKFCNLVITTYFKRRPLVALVSIFFFLFHSFRGVGIGQVYKIIARHGTF